jgi:mRNA interferase RelE/StbE
MFEIKLTPQAERAYTRLGSTTRMRVDRVLQQFENGDFRHPNIRALRGQYAGSLRYRLGNWRIVFRVDYKNQEV